MEPAVKMLLQERSKVRSKGEAESDTPVKPVKCYKNVNTSSGSQVIYVFPNTTTKQVANPDTSVKPVNCYKNMNTRFRNQVIVIPTIKRVKLENTGTKNNATVATQNSTSMESPVTTNFSQACDSGGQSSKTVNVQPKAALLHIPQSVVKSLKIASKSVPIPSKGRMILLNSPGLLNRETLMEASMDVIKQSKKAGGVDFASDQETPVFEVIQKSGVKTSDDGGGTKSSTKRTMISLLNRSNTSKSHCIDTSPFKSQSSVMSASKSCSSDMSASKSCSSDMSASKSCSSNMSASKSCSSNMSASKSCPSDMSASKSCSSDISASKSCSSNMSASKSCSSDMSASKSCSSDMSASKSCSSNMSVSMLRSTISSTSKSHSSDTSTSKSHSSDTSTSNSHSSDTSTSKSHSSDTSTSKSHSSYTSMSKSHTSNTTMSKSESEKQKSNLSVRNTLTTTIDLEKYSSIQLLPNKCKENDRNDTKTIKTAAELNSPVGLKDGPITLSVGENDVVILSNQLNISPNSNFSILKKCFPRHCSCPPEQQKSLMTDQVIYETHLFLFKYFPNITMLLIRGQEITCLFDKGRWYVSVSEVRDKLLSNQGRDYLENHLSRRKSGKKNLDADLWNYLVTQNKMKTKDQEEYMVTVEYLKKFQTDLNKRQRNHSKCDYWSVRSMDDNFYIKTKGRMWCKACHGHMVKESSVNVYSDLLFPPQEQKGKAYKSFVGTMQARIGINVEGLVELNHVDETDPNIIQFGYVGINTACFTAFKVNNVCFVSIHQLLMQRVVSVHCINQYLKNLNCCPRMTPTVVRNHLQKTDKVLSNSGWIDTNILRYLCCLQRKQVFSLKNKLITSIISGEIEENFKHGFQSTHHIANTTFGMATKNFKIKVDGSIEEVSGPDPILTMATSGAGKKSVKRSCGSLSPRASGKKRKMAGETSGKKRKMAGKTSGEGRKMMTDASDQVSTENKSIGLSPSTSGEGRQMVGELTVVNNGNHSVGQTEQLSEQSVCSQFEDSTKNHSDAILNCHKLRKQDFNGKNLLLKEILSRATGQCFLSSATQYNSSHNSFENSQATKNIESMECDSELSAPGLPTMHMGRPGQEVVPVGLFPVKSTGFSEETDYTVPEMMPTKSAADNQTGNTKPNTSTHTVCGLQQSEENNSVKDELDCVDSKPSQHNVCGLQQIEGEVYKDLDFEVRLAVKDEPDCEDSRSNPSQQNMCDLQQIEGEVYKDLDFEVRLAVKDEPYCVDSNSSPQNVCGLQQIEGEVYKDLDFEVRLAVKDEPDCVDSNSSPQNLSGLQQIEGEVDFEVRLAVKDEPDCKDSNPSQQNVCGLQQIEGEVYKDLDFKVRLSVKDEHDCEDSNPSPQNVRCPQQGEGEGAENWNS